MTDQELILEALRKTRTDALNDALNVIRGLIPRTKRREEAHWLNLAAERIQRLDTK